MNSVSHAWEIVALKPRSCCPQPIMAVGLGIRLGHLRRRKSGLLLPQNSDLRACSVPHYLHITSPSLLTNPSTTPHLRSTSTKDHQHASSTPWCRYPSAQRSFAPYRRSSPAGCSSNTTQPASLDGRSPACSGSGSSDATEPGSGLVRPDGLHCGVSQNHPARFGVEN